MYRESDQPSADEFLLLAASGYGTRSSARKARARYPSGPKLTTAKDGTAEVKISHAGKWLVRMVHMRRCADRDEADWESFWTSLSFAIR